jgi:hypothetical protein
MINVFKDLDTLLSQSYVFRGKGCCGAHYVSPE